MQETLSNVEIGWSGTAVREPKEQNSHVTSTVKTAVIMRIQQEFSRDHKRESMFDFRFQCEYTTYPTRKPASQQVFRLQACSHGCVRAGNTVR